MNMILTTIAQEKKRIEYMLTKYKEEYDGLPKGTVFEKKVGVNTYFYLKYREGKKVISKYVHKTHIEQLRNQIEKRKHIEAMMASLQEELQIANKALEGVL